MTGWLGELTFLNPYVLALLAGLPVLWFLLRITPPAPTLLVFPAARFLEGLIPESRTPSHTPWWILLLRMIIAAIIIAALAHPVINKTSSLGGGGPLRLVIDNGWEAAQTWDRQIQAARHALSQAGREKREIYLLTTAPEPSYLGPLSASEAESKLKGFSPMPWPSDYLSAREKLNASPIRISVENLWLGTGINGDGFMKLATALQSSGTLTYIRPSSESLPIILRPLAEQTNKTGAEVYAPASLPGMPLTLRAYSKSGKIIDTKEIRLDDDRTLEATFDLPLELKSSISRIDIQGRRGAGSTLWLDPSGGVRVAGIYSPSGTEEQAPLAESTYYITRALEPYARLVPGDIGKILQEKPALIILPDTGILNPQDLNSLQSWVSQGGLLVRFAGPRMTENAAGAFLTPVPVKTGERSMEGALTWGEPKTIAPFPENSPFLDFRHEPEIVVRRQLLAEPVEDMSEKVWAALEDGTPLITAAPLEQGMTVLIHTTASPEWSNLALSGTFMRILKRLAEISANPAKSINPGGVLQPLSVSDGFGHLGDPPPSVKPIDATKLDKVKISPEHPPGIYGRAGYRIVINLSNYIELPKALPTLPAGIGELGYESRTHERDLQPTLLLAASLLLLLDWILMLLVASGVMATMMRFRSAAIFLAFILWPSSQVAATEAHSVYAGDLYLAYIKTGNEGLDATTGAGLSNLATALRMRTSAEPAGVVGLNPETDELLFFPIIYWAVDASAPSLSNAALANIQSYMDHGGTLLFDTRDAGLSAGIGESRNSQTLMQLTAPLDIPPLTPAPEDHVLGRSFYLLKNFPGLYEQGVVWVEQATSANSRDQVSTVIIGSNDWAGAWAAVQGTLPGNQREMALRFGVNAIMYALTGNYKADQVHIPHILERLGQ